MGRALDDLVDLLELEQLEVGLCRGVSPDEDRQRVFGGQVAGQALVAAARTVEADRPVHSLHAYFLRPGDPAAPIPHDLDPPRDRPRSPPRRSSTAPPAAPMAAASRRAGSSRSSPARRSSTCRPASTGTSADSTTSS